MPEDKLKEVIDRASSPQDRMISDFQKLEVGRQKSVVRAMTAELIFRKYHVSEWTDDEVIATFYKIKSLEKV